jgi:hypothetical protein
LFKPTGKLGISKMGLKLSEKDKNCWLIIQKEEGRRYIVNELNILKIRNVAKSISLTIVVFVSLSQLCSNAIADSKVLSDSGKIPVHKNFFSNQRKLVAIDGGIYFVTAGNGHLFCCISDDSGSSWEEYDLGEGSQGVISTDGVRVYIFWCYENTVKINQFNHGDIPDISATATIFDLGYPQGEGDDAGGPSCAIDENGTLYLTWVGKDSTCQYHNCTKWSKSIDKGLNWSQPVNLSNVSYTSFRSNVIVDQANHVHIAWTGRDVGVSANQVWVTSSTDTGKIWTSPIRPQPSNDQQFNVCMASSREGIILLGFQANYAVHCCRSIDSGKTWMYSLINNNLSEKYCTDVQFAVDTQGVIYASYRMDIDTAYRFFISVSTNQGVSWEEWDKIYSDDNNRRAPCLRYSTWHNGGGALMAGYELDIGENRDMWFRQYPGIQIYNHGQNNEENHAPELDMIGDKTVTTGELLEFTISATDPDALDTLTYSAALLPNGASFNSALRAFSWIPGLGDIGNHQVSFAVVDNASPQGRDEETIAITVDDEENHTPELDMIGDKTVTAGELLEFIISATDPDATDILSYNVQSLPTGADFDSDSQTFSWVTDKNDIGSYTVTFKVVDDGMPQREDSEAIIIMINSGSTGSNRSSSGGGGCFLQTLLI